MKFNNGILIIGNFFNNKKGRPTTQAEELYKLLLSNSHNVFFTSIYINRLLRFFDIIFKIIFLRKKYTIINIQFYGGLALYIEDIASFLAVLFSKKIIFTLHGGAIPIKILKHPKWYLRVLKRADIITVPSLFLKESLSSYNLPIQIIENSIPLHDYKYFVKNSFSPKILWMRSFHPIYNPEMAINVISLLTKDFPDIKLFMAGSDLGYFDFIKKRVSDLDLSRNIEFIGYLDLKAKLKYAELCDIYICTNNIDNTPVSLIEMIALGLPIITTNVGGISYFLNKNQALFVSINDHLAMANEIKNIINDHILGKSLVSNSRSILSSFDEVNVYKKWDSLLRSIY